MSETAVMDWTALGELPELDEEAVRASVARDSFEHFVRYFWDSVPGAAPLEWNWHMSFLCREIQEATLRVWRNETCPFNHAINIPFGTSKSTICSILRQPWTWTFFPEARFISATHTQALAMDFSYKSRQVMASGRYRAWYPHVELARDSGDIYANTLGGERRVCTVGGKTPTGFHAHFIDVDDPLDPLTARSEAELDTAGKFVTEVIRSRVVSKRVAHLSLIMQRLHPRDPTWVMEETAKKPHARPLRKICLPGELSEDVTPALEDIRKLFPGAYGEDGLLDPRRLDRAELERYRAELGSYGYASQIMQKPVPRGGAMFKRFLRRARCAPFHARRVRYWDRAATQDGGCYTAGVLQAHDDKDFYIEHVVHGQWEPDERNDRIVATALRDRSRYGPDHEPVIVIEAESGSTGEESFRNLARRLVGFRVRQDRPSGSKDVRAEPWADAVAANIVVLCDNGESEGTGQADWDVAGYVQEHEAFRPDVGKRLGKYKDQVDASSGGYNLLVRQAGGAGSFRCLPGRPQGSKGPRVVVAAREELPSLLIQGKCLLVEFVNPYALVGEVMSNEAVYLHPVREESPPRPAMPGTRQGLDVTAGGRGDTPAAVAAPVPVRPSPPPHALEGLLDYLPLECADLEPADHQATWNEPVPGFSRPAVELVMTKEKQGKALWAFLLRKRPQPAEVMVFADRGDGDRRAMSAALAVCDTLRLPRETAIWVAAAPDNKVDGKAEPANKHVAACVKAGRHLVVG